MAAFGTGDLKVGAGGCWRWTTKTSLRNGLG